MAAKRKKKFPCFTAFIRTFRAGTCHTMFEAAPWAVLHLRENEFLYHHSHTAQEQALHSLLLGAVIHSVRVAFFIVALHCRSTLVEHAGLLQWPITHCLLGDLFLLILKGAEKKCALGSVLSALKERTSPGLEPAEQDVEAP